jgi:hypothetical protein
MPRWGGDDNDVVEGRCEVDVLSREEEESRTNKEDIDERNPDAPDKRPPWNWTTHVKIRSDLASD